MCFFFFITIISYINISLSGIMKMYKLPQYKETKKIKIRYIKQTKNKHTTVLTLQCNKIPKALQKPGYPSILWEHSFNTLLIYVAS